MTVLYLHLLLIILVAFAGILAGIWVLDRRVMRRRQQRDLKFAMAIANVIARKARIRPKVDRRVQRRRYAK